MEMISRYGDDTFEVRVVTRKRAQHYLHMVQLMVDGKCEFKENYTSSNHREALRRHCDEFHNLLEKIIKSLNYQKETGTRNR